MQEMWSLIKMVYILLCDVYILGNLLGTLHMWWFLSILSTRVCGASCGLKTNIDMILHARVYMCYLLTSLSGCLLV